MQIHFDSMSNISAALLYWLESVHKQTRNTVSVNFVYSLMSTVLRQQSAPQQEKVIMFYLTTYWKGQDWPLPHFNKLFKKIKQILFTQNRFCQTDLCYLPKVYLQELQTRSTQFLSLKITLRASLMLSWSHLTLLVVSVQVCVLCVNSMQAYV